MKNRRLIKALKAVTLTIAGLIPILSSAPVVLAASATVSLSSSGSAVKGAYVTVSIRENSGSEPVNAAAATLSYPTDKLQYISISSSNAFPIVAANSGGGGSVRVDRGALTAVTGSQTVASVTFKALSDSGSAAVSITSASVISANSNSEIAGGTSGTTIGLNAPAVAAPVAPPDTTPPTISNVKATDIKLSSVVIAWTTSEPATSEVNYGPTQGYGLAATDGNLVTDHKVTLNSALLTPGTGYHYMVKSADAAGNAVTSKDGTFTSEGLKALVTVLSSKDGKPLKGAKVTLNDQSAVTDAKGQATVSGLKIGKQYGTVTFRGKDTVVKADITSLDPKTQPAKFTFKVKPTGVPVYIYLLPLILIGALAWLWFTRPEVFTNTLAQLKKNSSAGPDKSIAMQAAPPKQAPTTIIRPNKPSDKS